MKIKANNSNDDVQVQLIPLIDVIFCILTFFLLAALQFSRQEAIRGINLDLAKANSGTTIPGTPPPGAPAEGQRLVLHVDGLGQIYDISKPTQTLIPKEQLRSYLETFVKQNPTKPLVLNAARSASYNDVIETLDTLRQVGGDRVSLGVIPGGGEQSATPSPGSLPNQVIPNTVVPSNPQDNFNPNLPTIDQAPPIPVPNGALPPGQGTQNPNPGVTPAPQQAPGASNATPQKSN
ncbi:MAG: biopolymer transporter ExbD [Calothrix sp. C42_A2020_038]|nr:biopolymer transporter ExbD [Calothrix sp. C42_A2020_038]